MGKGPVITGLVILIVLVGGAFALTSNSKSDETDTNQSTSSSETPTPSKDSEGPSQGDTMSAATITYDGNSFSPNNITVNSGDRVTIKNASSDASLDFNSDPHPVHTDDPDLNAGDIEPGESKTVTVTRKGSYGFHNHHDSSQRGKITIQ